MSDKQDTIDRVKRDEHSKDDLVMFFEYGANELHDLAVNIDQQFDAGVEPYLELQPDVDDDAFTDDYPVLEILGLV